MNFSSGPAIKRRSRMKASRIELAAHAAQDALELERWFALLDHLGLVGGARQLLEPTFRARRWRVERLATAGELAQHLVHTFLADTELLRQACSSVAPSSLG